MNMKQIISSFCLVLVTGFSTVVYAAEPMSFGVKVGGLSYGIAGLDKATKPVGASPEAGLLNMAFQGGGYFEYAFHDYVGGALDVNASFGTFGSLSAKGSSKDKYKLSGMRLNMLPGVVIYPMGISNDENGILRLKAAFNISLPLGKVEGQKNEEKAISTGDKDLTTVGMGVDGRIGYEIAGVVAEIGGGYEFTDFFQKDSKFKAITLGTGKEDPLKLWNAGLTLGYNVAVLLED